MELRAHGVKGPSVASSPCPSPRQLWFFYDERNSKLPILRDGQMQLARWGNSRGRRRYLPRTGWTWLSTVESGYWSHIGGVIVEIPANFALDQGVWVHVRQRIRGMLVLSCFSRKWRNATSELKENSEGVTPMRKPRKHDTPVEKVAVSRRHLIDHVPVSARPGSDSGPVLYRGISRPVSADIR